MATAATARAPRVFISYSHDSLEHRGRVWDFSAKLRSDGIDAVIDQYVPAPDEGFPRWMEDQIEVADFVLLVCSEIYLSRVRGKGGAGKGHGVLWESSIIYQHIYDAGTKNRKFLPVLLEGCQPEHIPKPLRAFTYYRVDTAEGYEDLYRRITAQPRSLVPPLGKVKPLQVVVPGEDRSKRSPEELKETVSRLGLELFVAENAREKPAPEVERIRRELRMAEAELAEAEVRGNVSVLRRRLLGARSMQDLERCEVDAEALLSDHPNNADVRLLLKQVKSAIEAENAITLYKASIAPRRDYRRVHPWSGIAGILLLVVAFLLIGPRRASEFVQRAVSRAIDIAVPPPPPPPQPAAPRPPELPKPVPPPVRGIGLRTTPSDPAPGQNYAVEIQVTPSMAGVQVTVSVTGSDGYRTRVTGQTDNTGRFSVRVPGGGAGVVDLVESQAGTANARGRVVF